MRRRAGTFGTGRDDSKGRTVHGADAELAFGRALLYPIGVPGERRARARRGRGRGHLARPVAGQAEREGRGAGAVGRRLDDRRHGERLADPEAESEDREHHGEPGHRHLQGDPGAQQGREKAGGGEQRGASAQPQQGRQNEPAGDRGRRPDAQQDADDGRRDAPLVADHGEVGGEDVGRGEHRETDQDARRDATGAQDAGDRDARAGRRSGCGCRLPVLDAPQRGERHRAARARDEQGEGAAAGPVGVVDQPAGRDRADQLAEGGADGEVAEVAVLFVRRRLAGHQRLGADDEAEMAEPHHPAPQGHRPQGAGQAAEGAAAGYQQHPHRQQGCAAAVVGAAAQRDRGEERQQGVHPGDDTDRALVRAQREGPVGDGGPGHRHRPLREAEGDDEAQQPAAVPPGPHGVVLPEPPRRRCNGVTTAVR